jgi:quercetin dioxygenase-like cupin family protein
MLLDEVLSRMTVEVEPFSICEMAPRGWLDMPKSPAASLHYVLSGTGALHLGPSRSHPLKTGDLVLVPAGSSHSIGAEDAASSRSPVASPRGLACRTTVTARRRTGWA